MTIPRWHLVCSRCGRDTPSLRLATVCPECQAPWLVRYSSRPPAAVRDRMAPRPWTMWRYREWMPVEDGEAPVSLGEGGTPLLEATRLGRSLGMSDLWIKDESQNPTNSFKARGLSAAVTRARLDGAVRLSVPTAGNAGVALSAYGRRAGLPVRVFAPRTTPPRILEQVRSYGADLELIDGHIGDCGVAARHYAAECDAFDVSTLREPYRIEGKKTMGLEVAEQLGWRLPDAVIYPTGGGTGLIGMWIAFAELVAAGWVRGPVPRLYSVQAAGCAPVVRAFEGSAADTTPWDNPVTAAAGLRVPSPLGGHLILRALRETGGEALAVSEDAMARAERRIATTEGIDASPEGGATLAGLEALLARRAIDTAESVVLFNTGAGWLYRVL